MAIDYVTQPESYEVHGWDISHFAGGVVDFSKAKDVAQFVFIKAMDGKWETRWWMENWAASKGFIARGAYTWLYPSHNISANTQAQKFYELIKDDIGELPPVVDFEKTYWMGEVDNPNASDLWGFVKTFEDLSGIKPIIYTGFYFWKDNGSSDEVWSEYDLWIANYLRADFIELALPNVPPPWTSAKFWQWTEKGFGEDYGVDKYEKRAVDLDLWMGTRDEFANYVSGFTPTDSTTPPKEEAMEYTATTDRDRGMSLRGGPGVAFDKVGGFNKYAKVYGNVIKIYKADGPYSQKAGDVWLNVLKVNEDNMDAWVAIIHNGQKFCDLDPMPSPDTVVVEAGQDIPVSITLGDDVAYERQTIEVILKAIS